jgi:Flp pilus assembly protein TadB
MPEKENSSWETRFEDHIKHLEKRIEEIAKKVEQEGEAFGRRIEDGVKETEGRWGKRSGSHSIFGGALLILIGLIWLGSNMGWFMNDIPWVPLVMIAVGVYLVLKHHDMSKDEPSDSR